jgi:hypothetical protein
MPGASVKQYQETSYAATSLSRDRATAPQLLRAWRGRWQVEALHWVRDVTFGEDLSQVHMGGAPQIMASLRNVAVGLMRRASYDNLAATCRRHAAHPKGAVALLCLPAGENQKTVIPNLRLDGRDSRDQARKPPALPGTGSVVRSIPPAWRCLPAGWKRTLRLLSTEGTSYSRRTPVRAACKGHDGRQL